jgi:hypothetical protein
VGSALQAESLAAVHNRGFFSREKESLRSFQTSFPRQGPGRPAKPIQQEERSCLIHLPQWQLLPKSHRRTMAANSESTNSNIDYHGIGTTARIPRHCRPKHPVPQTVPDVAIEFVVIDEPEGQKLQELQTQAIRRVLIRLMEKRNATATSEE